ncbi:MAG TPA: hypothetical protein VMZ31_19690 [Phycisphaerae bacterium]|nr:hypothetical protein [Phycisphaerae bacterium]
MNRLTAILNAMTKALPTPETLASATPSVAARDWAGFFRALADFATKLLPLLLPLFAKKNDQDG